MWLQERHAINNKFRILLHTHTRHLRSFSEMPHCSKWHSAHTYITLYNSSLLPACLCWPPQAVWLVTVQVQRNYRLRFHWHCITRMIPDTEHTISQSEEWLLLSSCVRLASLLIEKSRAPAPLQQTPVNTSVWTTALGEWTWWAFLCAQCQLIQLIKKTHLPR